MSREDNAALYLESLRTLTRAQDDMLRTLTDIVHGPDDAATKVARMQALLPKDAFLDTRRKP